MNKLYYIFIIFLLHYSARGQTIQSNWTDSIEISVLTCGPGQQVYDLFGHSAIRVKDNSRNLDLTYNYGTYDFNAPGFTLKFLRGQLTYFLSLADSKRFLALYRRDNRDVFEQKLRLSSNQKEEILRFLSTNMEEENRSYTYDFYFDNCTTRIRDLLEDKVENLNYPSINNEQLTFRDLLHKHLTNHPWTKFGMDIILGTTSDQTATRRDQMFLPLYYFNYLENTSVESKNLLSESTHPVIVEKAKIKYKWYTPVVVFSILLIAELIGFFLFYISGDRGFLKYFDNVWFTLLGISSLIFLFMWFLTDHKVCSSNWNLLWAGPWALFYFLKESKMRTIGLWLVTGTSLLFLLGQSSFPQAFHIATFLIAGITILKSMRILDCVRWYDNRTKIKSSVVVILFLLANLHVDSQEKIGGITLVAPPSEFQQDPMPALKAINANWVALIPYAFSRRDEAEVHFGSDRQWWGERAEGIRKSLEYANSNDLKVMLKPQVWIPGGWVGDMDLTTEEEWVAWEKSYRNYIMTFLELAIEFNVELFCVGTEYRISVVKREKFWRSLIKEIRDLYNGKLTYSANWDAYEKVPFWDALDLVGISAYFPLSDLTTAPAELLKYKWKKYLKKLRKFSDKQQKKILFSEYGYLSVDGSTSKTWELEKIVRELNINQESQANGFEALYEVFWDENFWAGGFIWKWFPEMKGHEGYPERDYTPQNKEAAQVIAKWYGRNNELR